MSVRLPSDLALPLSEVETAKQQASSVSLLIGGLPDGYVKQSLLSTLRQVNAEIERVGKGDATPAPAAPSQADQLAGAQHSLHAWLPGN